MRALDIENIGRIGLMFIDGDLLRDVMADPFTCDEDDTNYNIPAFNELKVALLKIERINPDLYISGVLWQCYPANKRMVAPAVVGKSLPRGGWGPSPGWLINDAPAPLMEAITQKKCVTVTEKDGKTTCYFPVKTAAGDVVGALELGEKDRPANIISNYTQNAQ